MTRLTQEELRLAVIVAHDDLGYITKDHEIAKQVLINLQANGHLYAELTPLFGGFVVTCHASEEETDDKEDLMGEVN